MRKQSKASSVLCAASPSGCHFTLWKDGLKRGGGPMLNEKLVKLLLEQHEVKGSTGVIALRDGQLTFTPKGQDAPQVSISIVYEKK